MEYMLKPVGRAVCGETGYAIELEPEYRDALCGLVGFSHLQILWWCSACDRVEDRAIRSLKTPYRSGPETLGVFATRSPARPNPLGLSVACVTGLDMAAGRIRLAWFDGFDGTPILDIKPYTPSMDRPAAPRVPGWCAHWPSTLEGSSTFNWAAELQQ